MSKLKPVKKTPLEKKLTSPPEYIPGKSYKWEPEDEFTLDGKEFSLLYNFLRAESARANATIQAFNVVQSLFESGIKEGTIVEMQDTPDPV